MGALSFGRGKHGREGEGGRKWGRSAAGAEEVEEAVLVVLEDAQAVQLPLQLEGFGGSAGGLAPAPARGFGRIAGRLLEHRFDLSAFLGSEVGSVVLLFAPSGLEFRRAGLVRAILKDFPQSVEAGRQLLGDDLAVLLELPQ